MVPKKERQSGQKVRKNRERHNVTEVDFESWEKELPAKHKVLITLELAQASIRKKMDISRQETRAARGKINANRFNNAATIHKLTDKGMRSRRESHWSSCSKRMGG